MEQKEMKDTDRYVYVINDEGLYNLMIESRYANRMNWVRENRALIDEVIENVKSGKKPQHYLAYPHNETCQCYRCKQRRSGRG